MAKLKTKPKTNLSVNLNKVALLRNSRGNDYPNLVAMAKRAIACGAHGITIHPRPDERHITYADVPELAALVATYSDVEYNIEGYPSQDFLDLVIQAKPEQCTLVPDEPGQLTSDHGWDVDKHQGFLKQVVSQLQAEGIRVSLFMDPVASDMLKAKTTGAERVELYTEDFARAYGTDRQDAVVSTYQQASAAAVACGLEVNAGHDLNLDNLAVLLQACEVLEVSIGHAIMVETFDYGYDETLRRYLEIIDSVAQQ